VGHMCRAAAAYDCFIHLHYICSVAYVSAQEVVSNSDSIVQGCSSVSGQTNGDVEYGLMMYNSDTLY